MKAEAARLDSQAHRLPLLLFSLKRDPGVTGHHFVKKVASEGTVATVVIILLVNIRKEVGIQMEDILLPSYQMGENAASHSFL